MANTNTIIWKPIKGFEGQPDRFNVTFKRCTQGYLMTITDVSYDRTI